MGVLLTPGLYRRPAAPVRPIGRLARGDIPVFLGYARRGPVGLAVRIESLNEFGEAFGAPLIGGQLHPALKGFFETGGRTAYIVRLTQKTARVATGDLVIRDAEAEIAKTIGLTRVIWRATASFSWLMIDPRQRKSPPRPEAANWVQLIERVIRERGERTDAPGAWANTCSVQTKRAERARTRSIPALLDDPRALALESLAGLERHSIISLSQTDQDDVTREVTAVPARVDAARQRIVLDEELTSLLTVDGEPANFDLTRSIRLTSVEFDVAVYVDGKLEQSFETLGPHPEHSFAVTRVTNRLCRSLSLQPVAQRIETPPVPDDPLLWDDVSEAEAPDILLGQDWSDPAAWPREGRFDLSGGTDGLEEISARDYLRILGATGAGDSEIAKLDEVALIAAPDLVLQSRTPLPADELPPEKVDCCDLAPPEMGQILGRVVEIDARGYEVELGGVEIDIAGPGGRTRTDSDGRFTVTGIPLRLVTIRLLKELFEPLEFLVQPQAFMPAKPVVITMTRLVLPRALPEDEVLAIQQILTNPAYVGPYKVAIIDPPGPDATLDDLRRWRARLGDDMRIGFFGPWLRVPSTLEDGSGGLVPCPPCGHVCGAFAAGELSLGIHRACANLPLRFVEGTMLEIGDAEQGLLNPVGINAIRIFPGRGTRAFGTRSLSSDPEWRYLTARRIVDAIEKTLERALHWMVFEPNTLMTRHAVATTATTLLNRIWRDGILAGDAPEAAYSVKCDLENNPDESRETGKLVVDIGVAPTTPFEFILFRVGNVYDAIKVTEAAR